MGSGGGVAMERYGPYWNLPPEVIQEQMDIWDDWLQKSLDGDDSGEKVAAADVQEWSERVVTSEAAEDLDGNS